MYTIFLLDVYYYLRRTRQTHFQLRVNQDTCASYTLVNHPAVTVPTTLSWEGRLPGILSVRYEYVQYYYDTKQTTLNITH